MKNFKKLALASVLCTGVCLTAGGQKPAPASNHSIFRLDTHVP